MKREKIKRKTELPRRARTHRSCDDNIYYIRKAFWRTYLWSCILGYLVQWSGQCVCCAKNPYFTLRAHEYYNNIQSNVHMEKYDRTDKRSQENIYVRAISPKKIYTRTHRNVSVENRNYINARSKAPCAAHDRERAPAPRARACKTPWKQQRQSSAKVSVIQHARKHVRTVATALFLCRDERNTREQ